MRFVRLNWCSIVSSTIIQQLFHKIRMLGEWAIWQGCNLPFELHCFANASFSKLSPFTCKIPVIMKKNPFSSTDNEWKWLQVLQPTRRDWVTRFRQMWRHVPPNPPAKLIFNQLAVQFKEIKFLEHFCNFLTHWFSEKRNSCRVAHCNYN